MGYKALEKCSMPTEMTEDGQRRLTRCRRCKNEAAVGIVRCYACPEQYLCPDCDKAHFPHLLDQHDRAVYDPTHGWVNLGSRSADFEPRISLLLPDVCDCGRGSWRLVGEPSAGKLLTLRVDGLRGFSTGMYECVGCQATCDQRDIKNFNQCYHPVIQAQTAGHSRSSDVTWVHDTFLAYQTDIV